MLHSVTRRLSAAANDGCTRRTLRAADAQLGSSSSCLLHHFRASVFIAWGNSETLLTVFSHSLRCSHRFRLTNTTRWFVSLVFRLRLAGAFRACCSCSIRVSPGDPALLCCWFPLLVLICWLSVVSLNSSSAISASLTTSMSSVRDISLVEEQVAIGNSTMSVSMPYA